MHGGRGARRRRLLLTAATVLVAACGASEAAGPPPPTGTVGGVGRLPDTLTRAEAATTTTAPATTTSTTRREPAEEPAGVVGERVDANRVLLIGDSLMASTSRRYGGQMCTALVPLGWAAEVDAETGRFIDFGMRVLDRRLRPEAGLDWDAVVVFLGNNYGSNQDVYREELEEIVAATAPRPTVLLTVTEFRADRAEVNAVIRDVAAANAHVQVLDWATVAAENPALQGDDGLHLTEAGRERLAFEVATVLGGAPTYPAAGECLATSFSDDSAGNPIPRSGGTSGGTSGGSRATATTTTAPRTAGATTTVPRTTAPGTTVPATTAPGTTVAATPPPTPAPQTTPAPTPPPPTQPADNGGDGTDSG
jgi:hypothetical protein